MIPRDLTQTIPHHTKPGFVTIIYGPRRVGKTVLLQQLTKQIPPANILSLNGDTQETRDILSQTSQVTLSNLVKKYTTILIDEAQRISNIGLSLKILIDTFPEKQFYVTGSSALELSRGIREPLTGRNLKYCLFPLSTRELTASLPEYQKASLLPNQLLFGGYPYLHQELTLSTDKRDYLISLIDDYLFRDVLSLKEISSPDTLKKLAILIAFQIGSEVSLNELSRKLNIDVKTVNNYLTLLKQSFIIFELPAFSRNLRKEIVSHKEYYFWDLGIRNALIDQFLPLDTRPDVGLLWENFLAIERIKKHEYSRTPTHYYFWRTYEQAEIDWVEISNNQISSYEFKYQPQTPHTPKAFKDQYHQETTTIHKNNYLDFIL